MDQTITIKCITYGNIEYYEWLLVHMTQLWMSLGNNHIVVWRWWLVSVLKSEAPLKEKPHCGFNVVFDFEVTRSCDKIKDIIKLEAILWLWCGFGCLGFCSSSTNQNLMNPMQNGFMFRFVQNIDDQVLNNEFYLFAILTYILLASDIFLY